MTKAEKKAIKSLESKGYMVITFSPDEMRNAFYAGDFNAVQDNAIQHVNGLLADYEIDGESVV